MGFEQAIEKWVKAQKNALDMEMNYQQAKARIVVNSSKKTLGEKECEAVEGTMMHLKEYKMAEINVKAAYQMMMYLRNPAGTTD